MADNELDNEAPERVENDGDSQVTARPNVGSRVINRLMQSPEDRKEQEKMKDKAKDQAKQELKAGAKQAEKAVAKTAVKGAARAAAVETAPAWIPVVTVILVILAAVIGIGMFVVLIGVGNDGRLTGSTFKQDASQNNIDKLLANGGDVYSRRKLDASDLPNIIKAMDAVTTQAKAKKPPDDEAVTIAAATKTLASSYSSSGSKVDQSALDTMRSNLDKLAGKGYGGVSASEIAKKIADLAFYYAGTISGQQKYQQCSLDDKTACNSFSIKIMHESGADPNFSGSAYEQYLYTKKNAGCYTTFAVTSTSVLAPGDLLFRDSKNVNGYGHVAIYLGNGRIASASITTTRSIGHPPQIGHWYPVLNAAARLKGGTCAKSS